MNNGIFFKLVIILCILGSIAAIMNVFGCGNIYVTVIIVGITQLLVGINRIILSKQTKVKGTLKGDKIIGVLIMIMGIVLIASVIIKIKIY